jgi:hypothetical protein
MQNFSGKYHPSRAVQRRGFTASCQRRAIFHVYRM